MEWYKEPYKISTDRKRLDEGVIHGYLSSESYWARGRSLEVVQKSIDNSLCFGVYFQDFQVGFARIVSDYCTFAWLCDVFILEKHRGKGLGSWLIECVTNYKPLTDLRLWILVTKDAHGLYQRYGGFDVIEKPQRLMVRWKLEEA